MLEIVLATAIASAALVLAVPISVLLLEVLSALAAPVRDEFPTPGSYNATVAVVVPAHDEGANLLPTLSDLNPQIGNGDRLIVVADNCSDDTASLAKVAGAEVLERSDQTRIGKGYALAYALAHLAKDPPSLVLFVDADCRVQHDMVPRLKQACLSWRRPVQACFLMHAPAGSAVDHRLNEFFWRVRNLVRPLGLSRLGLPVQLMGTGMIFPWALIRNAPLASANLVEDLKLGLDLTAVGSAPRFYPFVVGSSVFPFTPKGTETQRQRWIQGQLQLMIWDAPRYLATALRTQNKDLLVLVLDVLIPPFSMLLAIAVVLLVIAGVLAVVTGARTPVGLALMDCGILAYLLFLAWVRYGRDLISPRELARLPQSLISKLAFYGRIYFGQRAHSWTRTDRSKD